LLSAGSNVTRAHQGGFTSVEELADAMAPRRYDRCAAVNAGQPVGVVT
jgi:hypothetical protein